jgi:hypothetical protein
VAPGVWIAGTTPGLSTSTVFALEGPLLKGVGQNLRSRMGWIDGGFHE